MRHSGSVSGSTPARRFSAARRLWAARSTLRRGCALWLEPARRSSPRPRRRGEGRIDPSIRAPRCQALQGNCRSRSRICRDGNATTGPEGITLADGAVGGQDRYRGRSRRRPGNRRVRDQWRMARPDRSQDQAPHRRRSTSLGKRRPLRSEPRDPLHRHRSRARADSVLSRIGDEIGQSGERADLDDRPRINVDRESGASEDLGSPVSRSPSPTAVACTLQHVLGADDPALLGHHGVPGLQPGRAR